MVNGTAQKPMFLVYRKLGTMTFSAFDSTRTIDLDRLHGLRFIDLHTDMKVDVGTDCVNGALLAGAPFHFLQKITLKGNGKDAIIDTTGYGTYLQNYFDYGVAPSSTLPAIGTLVGANQEFNFLSRLDLALPYNKVPIDTALISSLFATLQLSVTIGSVEDEIVNSTNTCTWTWDTGTIDVYVGEIVNFRADQFGKIIAKQFYIDAVPSATQTNYEIPVPVGNVYRSMIVSEIYPSANPTPSTALVNNIQVKVGAEVLVDKEDDMGERDGALSRGIDVLTGAHLLDFSRDGLIGEGLDASLVNNMKLVLDVSYNSGNLIRTHFVELIPT